MKSNFKYAFLVPVGALFLAGCCTAHHTRQWEYKVDYPRKEHAIDPQIQETFLNEQAKDGWIFLQKDANGLFVFKRAKQ